VDPVAGSGRRVCYQYGMLRSRTLALLAVLAMLALPASSLAQSAGDEQYQDPLGGHVGGGSGNSGSGGHTGSKGSSGGSGSGGGGGNVPASSTPSTGTSGASAGTPSAGTPQATAAQSGKGQLPRTGFDVILTIELGLAMLLTGVVAQRMIVLRDRRNS
jgi:hypothetical protein